VSAVQACHNRSPVSHESSTDVPHRLLRSSVRCCRSLAPAIHQPPSTDCSTCSTFGCRSFASAGPTVWNSLPNNLRNSAVGPDQFRVSTQSENPPVCLLLAFRWQWVRDVLTYSCYTNVHLLTYLRQTLQFIVILYRRERLLQADNLLACTNVYLLRAVIQLGRLLANASKDISSACMSATDVWHTYVCCSTSWINIVSCLAYLTIKYSLTTCALCAVLPVK